MKCVRKVDEKAISAQKYSDTVGKKKSWSNASVMS